RPNCFPTTRFSSGRAQASWVEANKATASSISPRRKKISAMNRRTTSRAACAIMWRLWNGWADKQIYTSHHEGHEVHEGYGVRGAKDYFSLENLRDLRG